MPEGRRFNWLKLMLLPVVMAVALSACGGGGHVAGTAFYRERIALPPGAVFEATLEDVSRADAPAEIVSSVTITDPGNPPFNFSIPYSGEQIDRKRTYAVRGSIRIDDRLVMASDQSHPVITQRMPDAVTLLLRSVPQQRPQEDETAKAPPLPATFTGAHGLTLPATYEGVLPCADCPGIRWHLNLMPDQTFYLHLEYLERGGHFEDSGRWYLETPGGALALSGRGGTGQHFAIQGQTLQALDGDRTPLPETLGDTALHRADQFSWTDVTHPMRGDYQPGADGGTLTDCVSGHRYPVAGNVALLTEAGSGGPITLDVNARITEREGEAVVEPLDVRRTYPGEGCERHRATAPLANTYWRLVALEREPVTVREGGREPHLILREEGMQFGATVGCNQMGGTYTLDGERISFSDPHSTMMACLGALDELERRFKSWLVRADTWRLNGQSLEITTTDGATALFEAVYFQ